MRTATRPLSSVLGAGMAAGLVLIFPSPGASSRVASHKLRVVKAIILQGPQTQAGLIKFVPSTTTVGRVKIEVVNHDTRFHTFEINGGSSTPRWMPPSRGKGTVVTTFKKPGRYFADCPDASDQGISGVLTVKAAR
jgi:plastocyanin